MSTKIGNQKYFTTQEAAIKLAVQQKVITTLTSSGQLEFINVGPNNYLISESALSAFLTENTQQVKKGNSLCKSQKTNPPVGTTRGSASVQKLSPSPVKSTSLTG